MWLQMTESQIRIMCRLSKTQDGKDFLAEILKDGLIANHKQLLRDGKDKRDELVGYGACLSDLVGLFENCDIRLAEMTKPVNPDEPSWA